MLDLYVRDSQTGACSGVLYVKRVLRLRSAEVIHNVVIITITAAIEHGSAVKSRFVAYASATRSTAGVRGLQQFSDETHQRRSNFPSLQCMEVSGSSNPFLQCMKKYAKKSCKHTVFEMRLSWASQLELNGFRVHIHQPRQLARSTPLFARSSCVACEARPEWRLADRLQLRILVRIINMSSGFKALCLVFRTTLRLRKVPGSVSRGKGLGL